MNAVICWKEYRQQRGIWLAVAAVAALLAIGLALSLGSGWQAFQDERVRVRPEGPDWTNVLTFMIFALALAYGIICGAILLAGEKEETTLVFLDSLRGWRRTLWRAKLGAGTLLVLAQGLYLAVLSTGLQIMPWDAAWALPVVAADALIWGLVGSARCRDVLSAVLVGIGCLILSWIISFMLAAMFSWWVPFLLTKVTLAILGVFWAYRIFCATDAARLLVARDLTLEVDAGPSKRRRLRLPQSWHALAWLVLRQGQRILRLSAAGAFVLGLAVNAEPLVVYPLGTLLLGLICGLAVLLPEQRSGQERFLAAQRITPMTFWALKTGIWALMAGLLLTIVLLPSLGAWFWRSYALARGLNDLSLSAAWFSVETVDVGWFLNLWIIHGFCVGQFFGFWARRPITAAVLGGVIAGAISLVLFPSVLCGGVAYWQALGVPVLLLLGTGLFFRYWLTGRLYTLRPLLGLSAICVAAIAWLGAALWYRAIEVPDVGEPFDIWAFMAGFPPPEKNEAGVLIRRAAKSLAALEEDLETKLGHPSRDAFPDPKSIKLPQNSKGRLTHTDLLYEVLEKGWPQNDKAFTKWLDLVFDGEWFTDIHRAARLPLGVVWGSIDELINCRKFASLLEARALQLEHTGSVADVLEHIDTLLGLSRQFRNHSSWPSLVGWVFVERALDVQARWLEKVGPQPALLKRSLGSLQQDQASPPDKGDACKAKFLEFRDSPHDLWVKYGKLPLMPWGEREPGIVRAPIWIAAWLVPWEEQRQDRIASAMVQGLLRLQQLPEWEFLAVFRKAMEERDRYAGFAMQHGLPPTEGPGSAISAHRWGQWCSHSRGRLFQCVWEPREDRSMPFQARFVVTALALYEAEQGTQAQKLDDLMPRYLDKVPPDPTSGQPFRYRISKGERYQDGVASSRSFVLRPGQGVVQGSTANLPAFPVPLWEKEKP